MRRPLLPVLLLFALPIDVVSRCVVVLTGYRSGSRFGDCRLHPDFNNGNNDDVGHAFGDGGNGADCADRAAAVHRWCGGGGGSVLAVDAEDGATYSFPKIGEKEYTYIKSIFTSVCVSFCRVVSCA